MTSLPLLVLRDIQDSPAREAWAAIIRYAWTCARLRSPPGVPATESPDASRQSRPWTSLSGPGHGALVSI